jgi:hypothetical protein
VVRDRRGTDVELLHDRVGEAVVALLEGSLALVENLDEELKAVGMGKRLEHLSERLGVLFLHLGHLYNSIMSQLSKPSRKNRQILIRV